MNTIYAPYISILPEEIVIEIYKKVFDSCLDEMITLHELRKQKRQQHLYKQIAPIDCLCGTGIWCEDCLGDYDDFI
jgi:hypothetical protein